MTILRSTIALVLLSIIALAALAHAGPRPAHAEAQSGGAWLVISHKVYDYALWKREHDRSAELKRASFGWKGDEQYWVGGDRNHVMVMELFATRERAEAFAKSRELTYEMAGSGVTSQPEMRVVEAASAVAKR